MVRIKRIGWSFIELKRSSKLDPLVLMAKIEALRSEMERLIDAGASFNEIYGISVELDKLIVDLYKIQLGKLG